MIRVIFWSHHPASRDASSDSRCASGSFLIKLISSDKINRQCDLDTVLFGFRHQIFDNAGALLVVQGGTNLTKERGEKLSGEKKKKTTISVICCTTTKEKNPQSTCLVYSSTCFSLYQLVSDSLCDYSSLNALILLLSNSLVSIPNRFI